MFMKMFVAVKTLDTAGGGAGQGGGGAVIRGGQLRWANEASWSAAHSSSQVTVWLSLPHSAHVSI